MHRRGFLGTLAGSLGALALTSPFASPLSAAPLEKVRSLGVLRVGLYADNRPWSWDAAGQPAGIDVDLARALAEAFGVRADIALFTADEAVSDDLRNVVWRGGLLGFQPCDVMLHVPFDPRFAAQEDQVVFVAPYYRESFAAVCGNEARDCDVPPPQLAGKRLAAELDSIPDFYLLGGFGGVLRKDVVHYPTGYEAVGAVQDGKADFAVATRAQVDAAMADNPGGNAKRRRGPLPAIASPGWDIGMAVKENSRTLGFAIEETVEAMAQDGRLAALFTRHGVEWKPALATQPNT